MHPERIWMTAAAAWAAACIFFVFFMLSSADGREKYLILTGVTVICFAACSISAWNMISRAAAMEETFGTFKGLVLKKPGAGTDRAEEISPKGKMPKE
ncbi:MAG: hypothetical protein LBB30_00820 [Candidatus Methanoplasma sp.]|jgi:hypothetical protein|nr:hypothetical protein [Candidatus Methanoplasma sp.]